MKGTVILTVEEAQQNPERWNEMRNTGIGGTDISSIVGQNKWKSALVLWEEKTGRRLPKDLSDNEAVYWGKVHEANCATRFEELTGKKVRRCGTLQDEEYPFILANIDRWVVGENAGLEIKTANGFAGDEWVDDEVPDAYYLQCQWYMMVTGAERWYICCLIGGNHFVWKEIERQDGLIEDLRREAIEFWTKNVQGDVKPEIDGSDSTSESIAEKYPSSNGMETALPMRAQALLEEYDRQKALESCAKERKSACENALKELMGSFEVGTYQDRKVTWKEQAGKITCDMKKLQAHYPDAYAVCAKVGKPFRKFSVK